MDKWLAFLTEEKKIEIVKKDQWEMFYELVKATKGNFKNFVDDGCWSSTIDEFCEYMNGGK